MLKACELACGLCFGQVAVTAFVVLHPSLSDEQLPIGERSHHIGQVVMGLAFKRVANSEWRMFGDGQSIGCRKVRAYVATCVTDHMGMLFDPEKETFFELATKRVLDRRNCPHLEAGNPT